MPPLLAWFPDLPQLIDRAAQLDPWLGYGAIALAMLLENLIPPIPSEVILPLAGYGVARGDLALLPTLLAALAGTVLGAWCWYLVGRLVPRPRLEGWLERHGGRGAHADLGARRLRADAPVAERLEPYGQMLRVLLLATLLLGLGVIGTRLLAQPQRRQS